MTRAEKAKQHYASKLEDVIYSCSPFMSGIEAGVLWADQHPEIDYREMCCEVVRNTKMPKDLREHLINSFMRL